MSGATNIFQNESFLNYISDKDGVMPLAMSLDVTNNCNFRCCHCYVKDTFKGQDKMMDISVIKFLIDQMHEYGVASLYLTGGEPFIRNDMMEIIEYAKAKQLVLYIKSNASLINPLIIQGLKRCSVDDIQISVYGMNNHEYELVTGQEDSTLFDVVSENIKELIDAGINVKLRYVVLKENYRSCAHFVHYCKQLGLDKNSYFHAVDIHPTCDCMFFPLKHAINAEELAEMMEQLYQEDPMYLKKIYHLPKEYNKCRVGKNTIHICNDGRVFPCPGFMVEIGNIYQNSYHDIWENSKELNALRNLRAEEIDCSKCKDNDYCVNNCIGAIYNWNHHTSYTKRNKEFCAMKREQIQVLHNFRERGIL